MSFFTQAAPKVRQEGFAPSNNNPAPPSPPVSSFDTANMFFAHHIFPNGTADNHNNHFNKPNSLDFGDELAAMMAHQDARANSPHHNNNGHPHNPPPHNPFDTNSTAPYRPHNIFDVSSPPATNHHPPHFPAHFSLPSHHSNARLDFESRPDLGSNFGVPDSSSYRAESSFPDRRASSRSRSRSKPPAPRVSTKKRASISSPSPIPGRGPSSPTRPQAILIPPNGHGSHHHHPVSPLSLHMHSQTAPSAWFAAADAPFSLPTPDSIGGPGAFGSVPTGLGTSPKSVVSGSAKDSPPPGPQDAASKQAQLASEKRRRRRESHNAVERRRRDNINEKISELATLIPECMLDPSAGSNSGDASLEGFAGAPHPSEDGDDRKDVAGAVKANKGMILRKSVEYIRYLQQLVNAQATRNRELEAQLSGSQPPSNSDSASPHSHAHAQMTGLVLAGEGGRVMEDDVMSMTMSLGGGGGAGMGMDESPREEDEDQELEEERDRDVEDVDQDGELESRGRVTRGRPLGVPVRVKREEEGEEDKDMEE